MRATLGTITLTMAIAIAAAGCGRGSNHPPVYPVKGQVLFEGKPVPGAMVVFYPADAQAPRPYTRADKEGRFVISTFEGQDGAPAGEYGVAVEWRVRPGRSLDEIDDELDGPNRLPARYADPKTSGLRVRVAEHGNDLPPFKLTK